jgi:hypothetical protein
MNRFSTVRQAKEYLARRIAEEAVREGTPLAETERKMLYFSETDWTLPDMAQVSADFDRECDESEYEQKIAELVQKITSRDRAQSQSDTETWNEAVQRLSEEDHYLSLLVQATALQEPGLHGFLPVMEAGPKRPPHDRLKLWVTAFAMVFGVIGLVILGNWIFGSKFWTVSEWFFADGNGKLMIGLAVLAVLAWQFRSDLVLMIKAFLGRK